MSKIYLLTGAAGLLGSNIARQLVDAKEVVRALATAKHLKSTDSPAPW